VDLAKMSLWLVTLAKDHALTFVDHALRHGDSLVGLSRKQIEALHWDSGAPILKGLGVHEPLEKVTALRKRIREADESTSDKELRDLWEQAQFELDKVRLLGDLVIAAFFEGEKLKDREVKRSGYVSVIVSGEAERYRGWLKSWRQAERQLAPFHWEIELPEVFDRKNPGFDAFVGNPPFLGGVGISRDLGMKYFQWLTTFFPPAGHQCDLVAYFFRRAFALIRDGGCFGLIATNTISQGDTRAGGLRVILSESGEIFAATRRLRWPGLAAVIVSVVHIFKGHYTCERRLDGAVVPRVSAYLVSSNVDDSPPVLTASPLFTQGSAIAGQGFLFDDQDSKASPISTMQAILERSPRSAQRVLPYIGGEELNNHPRLAHHRYVICLSDLQDEQELNAWPELTDIVRTKVKPERDQLGTNPNNIPLKKRWWAYHAHRPDFYRAAQPLQRILAINCGATPHLAFGFLPTGMVYSKTLAAFLLDAYAAFCALQSRPHEIWARFFSSSMKDDLRYTPSDCFETFPFPQNWETHPVLEAAGKVYYEFRAALMIKNDEGLTKTYNRFHDPDERDPNILQLRDLHSAMDRSVLDAYGWTDIPTDCEFLLDYEIDEEEWGDKKKPYRYRWPDEVRDEVLARLLELNAQRAKEEDRSGAAAAKKGGKKPAAKRIPKASDTENLFS
jgi:hypothetical protein